MMIDFGSGLSVNELVGMPAWQINGMKLPAGLVFQQIGKAAAILVEAGLTLFCLVEIWGDGHSVWQDPETQKSALVRPTGQVIYRQKDD